MHKYQLALKEGTNSSSKKKSLQKNFIDNFIISNICNVFKVIYIKNCTSRKSWYENISSHVGGLINNAGLRYNVKVVTYVYSDKEQKYISNTYSLENIRGYLVVDAIFDTIKDVSTCDMLEIQIVTSPEQDSDYRCRYLFARN